MTPVLTWLGQAGFLIEAGGARLLIDPFFGEHEARRYPPPPVDDGDREVPAVTPVLTWLGQAGLLIEAPGARLLVDPFFSEHEARTYPPLLDRRFGRGSTACS